MDMLTKLQQIDNSVEMVEACAAQKFFVIGIPLFYGYSIGAFNDELPLLYPTRAEADFQLADLQEERMDEIRNGERDDDDEFEAEVLIAKWDGKSAEMTLCDVDGNHTCTSTWFDFAGLTPTQNA